MGWLKPSLNRVDAGTFTAPPAGSTSTTRGAAKSAASTRPKAAPTPTSAGIGIKRFDGFISNALYRHE